MDGAHGEAGEDAVDELYATLHRGYARYRLLLSGLGLLRRWSARRHRPSVAADLGVAVLATHSAASVLRGLRPATTARVTGWADALTSSAGSAGALASLAGGPPAPGVWPLDSRWAPGVAQWSMGGTSVLGAPGIDRAGRAVAVAAPFLVWPRGRRWLRESGLLAESAMVLAMFAGAGQVIIRGLVRSADTIDRQRAEILARHEANAALAEDELVRRSVIARTAESLAEIHRVLPADRPAAASLAAEEEARLRRWIAERHPPAPTGADEADEDRSVGRALAGFLAVASGVLRVGAAAQLVFETTTQRRPPGARPLTAVAAAHAVGSTALLARDGPGSTRAVVAGDLLVVALATATDARASRRGSARGWTRGYVQAVAGAAGAAAVGSPEALVAVGGAGAIVMVGSLAAGRGRHRGAVLRAVEEATLTAATAQLARWFRGLVGEQARRLEAATAELAREHRVAAAAAVRRDRQFLLHDSALQVLLWVQKPDLSDRQLLEWIDRQLPRLQQVLQGREPDEPDGGEVLLPGLRGLLAGFASLGMRPRVVTDLGDTPVRAAVARCVIEVCNEALANVLRHSTDREPLLWLGATGDELVLEVANRLAAGSAATGEGTGSRAMSARAAEVGGTVGQLVDGGRHVLVLRVPVARH